VCLGLCVCVYVCVRTYACAHVYVTYNHSLSQSHSCLCGRSMAASSVLALRVKFGGSGSWRVLHGQEGLPSSGCGRVGAARAERQKTVNMSGAKIDETEKKLLRLHAELKLPATRSTQLLVEINPSKAAPLDCNMHAGMQSGFPVSAIPKAKRFPCECDTREQCDGQGGLGWKEERAPASDWCQPKGAAGQATAAEPEGDDDESAGGAEQTVETESDGNVDPMTRGGEPLDAFFAREHVDQHATRQHHVNRLLAAECAQERKRVLNEGGERHAPANVVHAWTSVAVVGNIKGSATGGGERDVEVGVAGVGGESGTGAAAACDSARAMTCGSGRGQQHQDAAAYVPTFAQQGLYMNRQGQQTPQHPQQLQQQVADALPGYWAVVQQAQASQGPQQQYAQYTAQYTAQHPRQSFYYKGPDSMSESSRLFVAGTSHLWKATAVPSPACDRARLCTAPEACRAPFQTQLCRTTRQHHAPCAENAKKLYAQQQHTQQQHTQMQHTQMQQYAHQQAYAQQGQLQWSASQAQAQTPTQTPIQAYNYQTQQWEAAAAVQPQAQTPAYPQQQQHQQQWQMQQMQQMQQPQRAVAVLAQARQWGMDAAKQQKQYALGQQRQYAGRSRDQGSSTDCHAAGSAGMYEQSMPQQQKHARQQLTQTQQYDEQQAYDKQQAYAQQQVYAQQGQHQRGGSQAQAQTSAQTPTRTYNYQTQQWEAAGVDPLLRHAALQQQTQQYALEERAQNEEREERQRFFDQLSSFNQQYDVAINRSPARPHARPHARKNVTPAGAGALLPPGAVLARLVRTVSGDACAPRSQGYIYERTSCALRCCGLPLPAGLTLASAALVQGSYRGRPQAGSACALHHRA
jgi:hypothetical protein